MRMLTSADTSHSLQLPDDFMEKISLDSRGSTEASASVSSGEVATATLVDLTGMDMCTYTCTYVLVQCISVCIVCVKY